MPVWFMPLEPFIDKSSDDRYFFADMGRPRRAAEGGYAYHVLNRANARRTILDKTGDFEAFERVLAEALERYPIRICAYCVLPNHWHFVL